MDRIEIETPSKVNLFLGIAGRRSDDYHEISSVMQAVALCDRVELREVAGCGGLSVSSDSAQTPPGPANLAWKAAAAMMRVAAEIGRRRPLEDKGLDVFIRKRIPVASGLAGGSSDAAAVMVALNRMWGLGLPLHRMMETGLSVGSDVPFLVAAHAGWTAARVGGTGWPEERLPGLQDAWFVLAKIRGQTLATRRVYEEYDRAVEAGSTTGAVAGAATGSMTGASVGAERLVRYLRSRDSAAAGHAGARSRMGELRGLLHNDLADAAARVLPEVRELSRWLQAAGCGAVELSGSGPCVFGIAGDAPSARAVESGVIERGHRAGVEVETWVVTGWHPAT